ncbi:competence type IV pilus minor pilin ComGE [Streptococcus sp. H49]|uniref:competence type IV pilus minor pilin ComGE n=1 Tax=Streptococcus huangxiaojuni TaxID=3237239 RepID=UPI0034A34E45
MVIIKKLKTKAYILLESLIALGILAFISNFILNQIDTNRERIKNNLQQQEALQTAVMAVQTKQDQLNLNGRHIKVFRDGNTIYVYSEDKEILRVEKV